MWRNLVVALLSLLGCASSFIVLRRRCTARRPQPRCGLKSTALWATAPPVASEGNRLKEASRFSLAGAVRLAAFAFAVYGDPTGTRWYRTTDGALIGFQSSDLVTESFKAMVLVHLLRARDLPGETNLVERLLTGGQSDPYVVTEVKETRGADMAITKTKQQSNNPDFFERFALYVEEPESASLKITVKDQNLLKGDDVLGACEVPLAEVFPGLQDGEWAGWLDIQAAKGVEVRKKKPRVEMELQLVNLEAMETAGEAGEEEEEPPEGERRGPKSVLEGVDWNVLGSKVGGLALDLHRFHLACFLTNEETDTQAGIWRNRRSKEIIISFRGTEPSLKDFLTDLMIIQEPFEGEEDPRRVHSGFLRAFRAIRGAVYRAIEIITRGDLNGWSIDCTGHSLGGALAVLMAHDLALQYPEMAASGRIIMYSYGAPRVGNAAFCKDYDDRLRNVTYRVVNNLDVIPKMPRGSSSMAKLLEYEHCGRTVLLREEEGQAAVWVEGESPGTCPLREIDFFAAGPASKATLEAATATLSNTTAQDVVSAVQDAASALLGNASAQVPSLDSLMSAEAPSLESLLPSPEAVSAVQESVMGLFSKGAVPELSSLLRLPLAISSYADASSSSVNDLLALASNMSVASPLSLLPSLGSDWGPSAVFGGWTPELSSGLASAMQGLGLNSSFVESELKLMESLVRGAAIAHHMEPLYFLALERGFQAYNVSLQAAVKEQQA